MWLLAGCSFSFGGDDPVEVAVESIEGELADVVGLGPLDATCETPESLEVGATWTCTAVAEDGTVELLAELNREDNVNVQTTNVLLGDQVELVAAEATSVLSEDVPDDTAVLVNCGQESLILTESNTLPCTVEVGEELVDTTITITDTETTAFEIDTDPLVPFLILPALQSTAETVIESELAELIGLGPIDATCDRPLSADEGVEFNCTGAVDGQVAEFVAVVDETGDANVRTTNVVLADQVAAFVTATVDQLNQSGDGTLPTEALDCGAGGIILSSSFEFVCGLNVNGSVFDTTITITDPSTGAFSFAVAESPRS